MKQTRVVIIGAGISGLMCAERLSHNQNFEVVIVDKGNSVINRKCPAITGRKCLHCNPCNIMHGIGGCGAFSDGKFIATSAYGGWLNQYINNTDEYIKQCANILATYTDHIDTFYGSDELKEQCYKYDLHMQTTTVLHFGSDGIQEIISKWVDDLINRGVKILTNYNVIDINIDNKLINCIRGKDSTKYILSYDKLVLAPGRSGSDWFYKFCIDNSIPTCNNQIDIGVRVEMPNVIWREISEKIYEPKILYRTQQYGDIVRMFCFNYGGEVVCENTNNVLTVNGHANNSSGEHTDNCNFALLSTINFTKPFNAPNDYIKHICQLSNMISGGSVIVQRLGDLKLGRRTDEKRLKQSTTQPTLKNAVAGDLSLCMPKRFLDNVLETLDRLNCIAPGTNNYDTLLYAIEAKYYSVKPIFKNVSTFEIIDDIYGMGDGVGITRSLSQAGAMGLYIAEILQKG